MNQLNIDYSNKSKDKKHMKLERSREKEKEKDVNEESSFKPIKIQIPKNEYISIHIIVNVL